MKSDGSIIIDTKILDDGMEKGFEQLQDEMASVGITARKVGEQIEMAFSDIDVSKPIANAANQIRSLESQLTTVTAELAEAVAADDNKAAERLGDRQVAIYEKLEQARRRLAMEITAAANKEAAAEEKAARRAARAKEREAQKQLRKATKPIRRFNTRLREIATGALVFNLISAGLRKVTDYFGTALMANDQFAKSVKRLEGSLKTTLQPVLEAITPVLIKIVDWVNVAVQAIGRLFASLSGKTYAQIQKNAEALDKETDAINGTGAAAKKAQKWLASFDEINQAVKDNTATGTSGETVFEEIEMPEKVTSFLDELAIRFRDIFFEWENLNGEQIAQKLLTGLSAVAGGVIGFVLGGPGGALLGMTIGAGLGVVLSTIVFDGDGKLSNAEIAGMLIPVLGAILGGVIGFSLGGPGGALIGASIGLGISFAVLGVVFDDIKKAFGDVNFSVSEMAQEMGSTIWTALTNIAGYFKNLRKSGTEDMSALSNAAEKEAASLGNAYNHKFGMMGVVFDALVQKIMDGSLTMAMSTEKDFIDPATVSFGDLFSWIGAGFKKMTAMIAGEWKADAASTEKDFAAPSQNTLGRFFDWLDKTMGITAEDVVASWEVAARGTEYGYIIPTRQDFEELGKVISNRMDAARKSIQEDFGGLAGWFKSKVIDPIGDFFEGLGESIEKIFKSALDGIEKTIDKLSSKLKKTESSASSSSSSKTSGAAVASYAAASFPVAEIPQLAKGAVIPPNNKFLAVLGDQRSGTNVEAPLATIQEAVALVMEDMMRSNMAGQEATITVLQQILEAVLGIELDGETLSNAVNNYNRKMAIVRGG